MKGSAVYWVVAVLIVLAIVATIYAILNMVAGTGGGGIAGVFTDWFSNILAPA